MNNPTPWPLRRAAIGLAALVAGCAFALSFAALQDLAVSNGVPEDLAPLWPIVVDATIICGTLLAVNLPGSRYAWTMLGSAVGASILGNAVHAAEWGPVGIAVAAVPPVALVGCTHALVLLGRARRNATTETTQATPSTPQASLVATTVTAVDRQPVVTPAATSAATSVVNTANPVADKERKHATRSATKVATPATRKPRPARRTAAEYLATARIELDRLAATGQRPEVTTRWVTEVTGCGSTTAKRIAAELRTPHVVTAGPEAVTR